MKIKRKIVRADTKIVRSDFQKQSRSFIADTFTGDFIQPSFVQISDDDAWNFYLKNDWIGNVIDRIATDCVTHNPLVVPIDKSVKIKPRSTLANQIKEANAFFFDPNNSKEGFDEIREKAIKDLLIFGRGAIEKVVDEDTRKLEEVWSVISKDIRLNSDNRGNLPDNRSYKLLPPGAVTSARTSTSIAAKAEFFDFDQLIFMVLNPISRSNYGVKKLDKIAFSVAVDILRATYNGNFFVNGAEAAGILGLLGMNKKEMRKFKAYWNDNFKGAKKAHKTAITNADIKYVRMAITNRDLQFSEYGVELRNKIFSAYGMQPLIMGVIDSATGRLNSTEQNRLYRQNALKPILNRESRFYTREILHMGFGFRKLEVVFPSVDLADEETQSRIDERNLKNGLDVINEIRARRGKSDVSWGDSPVAVMPGGVQIDPDSGRLIQVGGVSAEDTGHNKEFLRYFESLKVKTDALLHSLDRLNYIKCNIEDSAKTVKMNVNGQEYILKRYTLPVKFRGCDLDKILDKILDVDKWDFNEIGEKYMECICSRIKHEIVFNIMNGTTKRIPRQIERIKSDEVLYGMVGINLNGNTS